MSGWAARACLEAGLHKERLGHPSADCFPDGAILKDLFSCIYDLDRRCSFFTNLPWVLHDKDIDDGTLDLVC